MERAAAVAWLRKGTDDASARASLEELRRLWETAGGVVEKVFTQERPRADAATLIGAGKVMEIASSVRREKWDAVVFDDDLSPSQQKNLQEAIPAKIIDRTRLILDIFAQRARTREGKLQVELAQLNYLLPRVTERYGRFEQQTGGIGTRGPGERKLEISQRRIRDRVARLKQEIEKVRVQRAQQKENRRRTPLPSVALVGYTNAGKSTLLNVLRSSPAPNVYADDKLFATLDPTTRRAKLPSGRWALFVDTVGFIQRLPHDLVAAFHATLEEALGADVLAQVIDASDPAWANQERVVEQVLFDLGAEKIPRIRLFNKADLLSPRQRATFTEEGRICVSARTGRGLSRFLAAVETLLDRGLEEYHFVVPHSQRHVLPVIYAAGRVLSQTPTSEGTRFRVMMDPKNGGWIRKELKLAAT